MVGLRPQAVEYEIRLLPDAALAGMILGMPSTVIRRPRERENIVIKLPLRCVGSLAMAAHRQACLQSETHDHDDRDLCAFHASPPHPSHSTDSSGRTLVKELASRIPRFYAEGVWRSKWQMANK